MSSSFMIAMTRQYAHPWEHSDYVYVVLRLRSPAVTPLLLGLSLLVQVMMSY